MTTIILYLIQPSTYGNTIIGPKKKEKLKKVL